MSGTSGAEVGGDLVKVREWDEANHRGPCSPGCGCDDWPAPPRYTEYRVEGQMRADVLARLARPSDDPCTVRMIQGVVEGGYSEYTVEHDYPIEVWVDDNGQSQRVFDDSTYWQDDSLAAFLRWLTAEVTP